MSVTQEELQSFKIVTELLVTATLDDAERLKKIIPDQEVAYLCNALKSDPILKFGHTQRLIDLMNVLMTYAGQGYPKGKTFSGFVDWMEVTVPAIAKIKQENRHG